MMYKMNVKNKFVNISKGIVRYMYKIFVKVNKLHRQVDIPLVTRNVFTSEHNVKF